jgi:hypothetical protein
MYPLSYTPLIHPSPTLLSYTPLLHSSPTLLSYIASLYATPLLHSLVQFLRRRKTVHESYLDPAFFEKIRNKAKQAADLQRLNAAERRERRRAARKQASSKTLIALKTGKILTLEHRTIAGTSLPDLRTLECHALLKQYFNQRYSSHPRHFAIDVTDMR